MALVPLQRRNRHRHSSFLVLVALRLAAFGEVMAIDP
jgi:hypothetical protein